MRQGFDSQSASETRGVRVQGDVTHPQYSEGIFDAYVYAAYFAIH